MAENDFLVTVIITTYKRPKFLNRAIDSVLNQTYKNIELIVIDDNNRNSLYRTQTEKVMSRYQENSNVKYIKHSYNKNGAAARNTGLKNAHGTYVTYLDDDDYYLPEKVERQVDFLTKHLEYKAVYCGWERDGLEETPLNEGDLSYEILSGKMTLRTNTIMMDKKISIEIGGWDEQFQRNQEAVYLLRYFKNGHKIGSVPEVLVKYDITDRSNASNPQQNEEDFLFFLKNHKEIIENLEQKGTGKKSSIYINRYRGVLNTYLANKDYLNSLKMYLKGVRISPVGFNIHLINHFFKKIIK